MRKLNNKGWSNSKMIFMVCFLLIMLGISWYYISSLYKGISTNNEYVNTEIYESLQSNLRSSAKKLGRGSEM